MRGKTPTSRLVAALACTLCGYNVVFVQFSDGRPVGQPVELLSGFVSLDGAATAGRWE